MENHSKNIFWKSIVYAKDSKFFKKLQFIFFPSKRITFSGSSSVAEAATMKRDEYEIWAQRQLAAKNLPIISVKKPSVFSQSRERKRAETQSKMLTIMRRADRKFAFMPHNYIRWKHPSFFKMEKVFMA